MSPCTIGFSGRIKSGKTTVAKATADALGWPFVSFGDYIRAVARQQKQDSESRPVLQRIGESLIAQGWPAFCRNVLATISWQAGNPAVIDGIRHVEAVDNLRAIVVPLAFVLVHVKIDDVRQLHRVRLEQGTLGSVGGLELHSTEADVKSRLPELADVLVDGARPIEDTVAQICDFLKETVGAIEGG